MTTTTVARERLAIDGCSIALTRGGAGPPLLFLHGPEPVDPAAPVLAELMRRFTVIAPDHPGFGESDTPEWLTSVHDLAYFYDDVLAALGVASCVVAGHGLGAWIACEMAVRSTARVRALALAAPAGLRPEGGDGLDWFMLSADAQREAQVADPAHAPPAPVDERTHDLASKNALAVTRLCWQPRFYDPQLGAWLHRVDVPVLVVWGRHDRIFPVAQAQAFARRLHDVRVEIFEDCGHLPHLESPERFAGLVAALA